MVLYCWYAIFRILAISLCFFKPSFLFSNRYSRILLNPKCILHGIAGFLGSSGPGITFFLQVCSLCRETVQNLFLYGQHVSCEYLVRWLHVWILKGIQHDLGCLFSNMHSLILVTFNSPEICSLSSSVDESTTRNHLNMRG